MPVKLFAALDGDAGSILTFKNNSKKSRVQCGISPQRNTTFSAQLPVKTTQRVTPLPQIEAKPHFGGGGGTGRHLRESVHVSAHPDGNTGQPSHLQEEQLPTMRRMDHGSGLV
jgi:hypothetical protein